MNKLQGWWAARERARQPMLCAFALMALSQFACYEAPHIERQSHSIMPVGVEPDPVSATGIAHISHIVPAVTGWRLRPHARIAIGVLVCPYPSPVAESRVARSIVADAIGADPI